jgi:hypothetical protein
MEARIDLAGVGGEADLRIDAISRQVANDAFDREIREVGLAGDFAGDEDVVGGDEAFRRQRGWWSAVRQWSENGVADLVGDLVRVPHGNGFAGKEVTVRGHC